MDAIQVTVSLEDDKARNREFAGLSAAMEKFNLPGGTILILNDETPPESNDRIRVKSLLQWLLEAVSA